MTTLVLDIGGTAIKSGLYIDGMLTDIKETPTEASQGSSHVTARAKEIIAAYQQRTFHNSQKTYPPQSCALRGV